MTKPVIVSIAEYSRIRKVSPKTIYQWIKKGKLRANEDLMMRDGNRPQIILNDYTSNLTKGNDGRHHKPEEKTV